MAVATGYVGSAVITWAASTTATVSGQSIGTASPDRVVIVAVSIEADFAISSCTIGGTAATAGPVLRNTTATPDVSCAFFYLPVPTGTTANVAVTLSGSSSSIGRISVWAMTGAMLPHTDSNTNQGTGTNITLTGVTVPPNGAGFWAWANVTNAAMTWTNATERDDSGAGASGTAYQHAVADTTTAGSATITADGANAQQTIIGMSFGELPPTVGIDLLPQNEKAVQTTAMLAFIAASASGVIISPYPYEQIAPVESVPGAEVIISQTLTKTLYYQAKIAPPPQPFAVVAPTTMDWVQPLSTVPPSTKRNLSDVIYAFPPPPAQFSLFDVRTTYLSVKVLHYQDRFEPVVFEAAAASNLTTTLEWMQAFQRAVPVGRYNRYSNVTYVAPPVVAVTPDEWLQPFGRTKPARSYSYSNVTYVAPPVTAVTPDEWMQQWRGPPRLWPLGKPYQPFIPEEATIENTVPGGWMQPFTRAVPALRLNVSQVAYTSAPVAEVNTRTEWDWPLQWNLAAPARKPIHTQPLYGFPYEGVDNTRNEWDWTIQWRGPPRLWPLGKPYQPFVPREATRENTITGIAWLQAWRGPPRYTPIKVQALPFVPREATLENTITGIAWLQAFRGAPPRRAVPTQPFYGFPYEAASNLTTTLEWMQAWRGPPQYKPVKILAQPFVPREATRENTQTPDKWMRGFLRAVPSPKPIYTQPVIGYPVAQPVTLTTSIEWLQGFRKAVPGPTLRLSDATYTFPPAGPSVTSVHVVASLTVEFTRVLRYVCRAEVTDGFVDQAECIPAFESDAFQSDAFQTCEDDPWATQTEVADAWDDEQQVPASGCCDED